MNITATLYLR